MNMTAKFQRGTMTIGNALDEAREQLKCAGVPEPQTDAEWLLAHALGCNRLQLHIDGRESLPSSANHRLDELLALRAERIPLPHLLGNQEFMGLTIDVDKRVMIPRPETERLVEAVIQVAQDHWPDICLQLLDVGTGSGAIAVSLARLLNNPCILATDISPDALDVASRNAKRHKVDKNVTFLCGNLTNPITAAPHQPTFHGIIANLPYIPTSEIGTLQPELTHEPYKALDGGRDGLTLINRLVLQSFILLKPNGFIALEVGIEQAETVHSLLSKNCFSNFVIHCDYNGVERVVVGFKQ